MDAVVAIVVVDAEEVDTGFNIHLDVVDHVAELHHAHQLTGHVVDGHAVEVLAFEGDLRSGGVMLNAGKLVGRLLNAINTHFQSDRNVEFRIFNIVGGNEQVGMIFFSVAHANGVECEGDFLFGATE